VFADLFGFGGMFGGGGGGGSRGPRRTQDIRFKLDITLSEFYNGATKKLKVKRDVICIECAGRGSKTDGAVVTCDQCRGTGVQVMIRRLGPGMVQQMQTRCDKCNGQKEIISEKDRCAVCEGKKVVKQEKVLEVFVDRGAKEGQTIKFREAADQAPGAETGDIIVVLAEKKDTGEEDKRSDEEKDEEEEDFPGGGKKEKKRKKKKKKGKSGDDLKITKPTFKRLPNGIDLVIDYNLSLTEALLGYEFAIRHLDDRIVIIKSQADHVTSPNDVVFVEGEGMPVPKRTVDRGDLYIKMNLVMPTSKELGTEETRKKLRDLLPKVPPLPSLNPKDDAEKHVAKPFDETAQAAKRERDRQQARQRHGEDDEDDSEGQTHTCRTQ